MSDLQKAFPNIDPNLLHQLIGDLQTEFANVNTIATQYEQKVSQLLATEGPEVLHALQADAAALLTQTNGVLAAIEKFAATNPTAEEVTQAVRQAITALENVIKKLQG